MSGTAVAFSKLGRRCAGSAGIGSLYHRNKPSWHRVNYQTRLESSSTDKTSLPEHVRLLFRRVPHPVVILTTRHPDPHSDSMHVSQFRVMTVSSLTSVCLKPHPIISFNMKLPSKTYDALKANHGHFLVHFIDAAENMAYWALQFTKGQDAVQHILSISGSSSSSGDADPSKLSVVPQEKSGSSPMIGANGIIKVLGCKLLADKEIHVQDHVVLCAEICDVYEPSNLIKNSGAESNLIYVDGRFREAGREINAEAHSTKAVDPN